MATKNTRPTRDAESRGQDAIALLTSDHEKVRGLLSELDETTERGAKKRKELLLKIGIEVRVHKRIEEEIFYPAYKHAAKSSEDEKLFFEAADEHGVVDIVLPALEGLDPSTVPFGARAKVLKDLIEHHAEEEEEEMFPKARKLLGKERLSALGAAMEARKVELLNELSKGTQDKPGKRDSGTRVRPPQAQAKGGADFAMQRGSRFKTLAAASQSDDDDSDQ